MTEEKKIEASSGRKRKFLRWLAVIIAGLILLAVGIVVIVSYQNTITPSGIVFHHSAVPLPPDGSTLDVRLIDEIHRRRGFGIFYWGRFYHIGYHYLILPDGTVQSGRPEYCQGAHATGYNSYIGICLVGDFTDDNLRGERGPKEPTTAQIQALLELTSRLRDRYNIPLDHVIQHRDVNPNTQCPGDHFHFPQLVEQLKLRKP